MILKIFFKKINLFFDFFLKKIYLFIFFIGNIKIHVAYGLSISWNIGDLFLWKYHFSIYLFFENLAEQKGLFYFFVDTLFPLPISVDQTSPE